MKLKGIELEGTYEVRYYATRFEVYNGKGNMIYYEDSRVKRKYDEKGNMIYYEDNNGYWSKSEYNEKGNIIYLENSNGYWSKREYDEKGNEIFLENSDGKIIDKKVKELTIEEIEKLLGYKIKIKGERKWMK